jgi:uracil-DNA glycosylase
MLNSCLTVQARQANSHSDKGWERFTEKVIDIVDKYGGASIKNGSSGEASGIGRGVVFLAWGAFAQQRVARLDKVSSFHCSFFF